MNKWILLLHVADLSDSFDFTSMVTSIRTRKSYYLHNSFHSIHEFLRLLLQFQKNYIWRQKSALSTKIYVSLQLRVQNRRRKWHFLPNFRNGIIWTAPFLLNIRNNIIWGGAFSKAFRSSEALILVLSKNARLCFRSSEALISVLSKNAHLYDNI